MAIKVSVEELPAATRIKSRNDFITSIVESWLKGEGLQGNGIAVDIARAQAREFIDEMRTFYRERFGSGAVHPIAPERSSEVA